LLLLPAQPAILRSSSPEQTRERAGQHTELDFDRGSFARPLVATMAPCTNGPVELVVDVAVVGGGVVGVLAGLRLLRKGIDFAIFERQADFGGVWVTHGNNHSTLQVKHTCLS